ncbi:MAG: glycosyl hydrolase family 79 C-terminal domain-containing protein [Solirubrobacteraceae bacterium]
MRRPDPRQRLTMAWTAVAACVGMVLPAAAAGRPRAATVALTTRPITRPIPRGFLGLLFEFGQILRWVPAGATQPDPVLLQLIRNLNPSARPVIRIGGLSTDRSWWPVPGMARPLGVTYTLGPSWAWSMTALARALNAELVLGVNLEADSTRIARTEADAFLQRISRRYIEALDIGNEPPLYDSIPWYRVLGGTVVPWYEDRGTPVFSRSLRWGPSAFAADYAKILGALPRVPILGPDTQQPTFFAAYKRFLSPHFAGAHRGVTRLRTQQLRDQSSRRTISDGAPPAHRLRAARPAWAAEAVRGSRASQRGHISHRRDGSVTCNGRWGVSNTMASALWAVGALASVARDGVDGVNLHSTQDLSNALFDFSDTGHGWTGVVHPIYYGALLFAHAAPAGSRLLRVRLHGPATLHAWATAGTGITRRVLLLNDSSAVGATVTVRPPPGAHAARTGQLERLSAASASATGGLTIGARTFGPLTTTPRVGSSRRCRTR